MNFKQILQIVKARKLLVISTFCAIVALVMAISYALPEKYTATAAVIIDAKSPDPLNGMIMPGTLMPGYIATQLDVLRSDRVTLKAIRSLRLDTNGTLREQWNEATAGKGDFEAWLAELLQKNLDVVPAKESSVLNVAYTAVDPSFAAAMTNAFVKAYIDTTLELRVEPAKRFSELFDEQVSQNREKLEQAQSKLSMYQQQKGIIATDERLDIESARLAELSNQLVVLQALSADSTSRKAQANANMSEVLNNSVVASLKADMSRQEARLKELSSTLGNAHPQVLQLQANIQEMRARIDAEVKRVTSSVTISDTINTSKEAQIRASLDAQRAKVLKLKAQRDEVAVLVADVANAQRAYEGLQARFEQSSLESQSNQTNVSVLKVATPPSEASSPKILINTVVAVVLGAMIAVGLALLRESTDRRVRQEDDVLAHAGSICLGTMPVALEAKRGSLLPVRNSPRLTKRALPELTAPQKA